MKVKGKELILKVVSLVAVVLSFVGLALKLAYKTVKVGDTKVDAASGAIKCNDWWDSVKNFKDASSAGYAFWQVAKVFLIVALVALAILAVITIIEFFFQQKYLALAKKIVAYVAVASVIIFFASLVIGGIIISKKYTVTIPVIGQGKISFAPNVGAWFILVFGLVASVVALFDRKKA